MKCGDAGRSRFGPESKSASFSGDCVPPLGRCSDSNASQKEHDRFERLGDDLRTTIKVPLKEALTGWKQTVNTIDGRNVSVSGSGPTPSGYETHFPELGMPKSKKPGERGDMIVRVQVDFPTYLTPTQKGQLKDIL